MHKVILVTGGAGFIGSNFVTYFCEKYPEYDIVSFDKLTYAADLNNLQECESQMNYLFVHGDICDFDFVLNFMREKRVTDIIHFAAESHVDNSIKNPGAFINTNIVGTFNLLEAARQCWMDSPGKVKEDYKMSRFHHVSTDEVFGTLGKRGEFTEESPYAPNSPYAASKASSDFLVRSYYRTYGLNVTTSHCSNNYGPKQHPEKLIPNTIRRALEGKAIPVYGDGMNVRDWLYVSDHCEAIDLIFHNGRSGETYNIGCENEITNIKLVETVCYILDRDYPKENTHSYIEQITFVEDRAGHDFRYAIDASKIRKELGWRYNMYFEEGIEKTVDWYAKKYRCEKN